MVSVNVRHIPPSRWWQRARWQILQPLCFGFATVPRGFVTDGISTPWLLAWLVSPTGKGFAAAMLHDHLLSRLNDGASRANADAAFKRALLACQVSPWRAQGMYIAVRLFAWLKGAY